MRRVFSLVLSLSSVHSLPEVPTSTAAEINSRPKIKPISKLHPHQSPLAPHSPTAAQLQTAAQQQLAALSLETSAQSAAALALSSAVGEPLVGEQERVAQLEAFKSLLAQHQHQYPTGLAPNELGQPDLAAFLQHKMPADWAAAAAGLRGPLLPPSSAPNGIPTAAAVTSLPPTPDQLAVDPTQSIAGHQTAINTTTSSAAPTVPTLGDRNGASTTKKEAKQMVGD